MRTAPSVHVVLSLCALGAGLFGGCSSEGGGARLPSAISSRWTPPPYATRTIDAADVRAVTLACKQAAQGGGYSVQRIDEAAGFLSAARRQTNGFDGSRQDTLEVRVKSIAPGVAQVSIVLREVVETGSRDDRNPGLVTSGIVRDRASYDFFFERLAGILAAR